MEKNNVYQLAKSYNQFQLKTQNKRSTIQSLPVSIIQDEQSDKENNKKEKNMFINNVEQRLRKLDLQNEKAYAFVGMREMKDFIIKMDKKRKHYTGSVKLSFCSGIQSSLNSHSHRQRSKSKFLTKQELMDALNRSKNNQSIQEAYLSDQNSIANKYAFNIMNTISLNSSSQQRFDRDFKSQQGRLKKTKVNLQKYTKLWNKQMVSRQKGSRDRQRGCKDNKSSRFHAKVNSSLLHDSNKYRLLKQKKQKLDIIEHINNIQPREWDSILRNNASLQRLHQKDIEHIFSKGWMVNGSSKLQKQITWIAKKDREGHFFKKIKGIQ